MAIKHQEKIGPQNAVATMTTTTQEHENMDPQNAVATMTTTDKDHEIMAPQNAVANKMGAFATKEVDTPDNAEPASKSNNQKHKSVYQKKREKRKKKKEEKEAAKKYEQKAQLQERSRVAAMDNVFIPPKEFEYSDPKAGKIILKAETQEEINDKIQAMDREFEYPNSQFKKDVLDKQTDTVKLIQKEQDAIRAYTVAPEHAGSKPCYVTMNNILRKRVYKEGEGEEDTSDTDVEKSKQNYDAVTDCINALQKSKLPQDMVFRRITDLKALLGMLRLEPSPGENLEVPIKKEIDKYNEGNEIIFDRGFLSTAAFSNSNIDAFLYDDLRDQVEWMIQGHVGDEALFIKKYSMYKTEDEMLFQAGTQFRLLRICPPGAGGVIYKRKNGQQKIWKVYIETVGLEPLRGKK